VRKFGVVVVGCGAVAYRWYFKGLIKSSECEITALVDTNQENLKEARKYCAMKETQCFDNFDSFFHSSIRHKTDIALILTPHHSHYSVIKKCLSHGLHVYSEKPFATNSHDAVELVKLAASKTLTFCSAPQVMLSTRNLVTKTLVQDKIIGDVVLVRASGSNMGPADRPGVDYDPRWFYQDGGSISSLGIYTLALVQFLFGSPNRVSGYSGISIPDRTVKYGPYANNRFLVTAPDNEVAILDYNGMYVLFDGSYCVKHPVPYELIIHGTDGTLHVGGPGGKESVLLSRNDERTAVGPDDACHLEWNLCMGVDEMARSMRDNRDPTNSARFAAETIEMIEAIRRSSQQNSVVVRQNGLQ